MQMNRTNKLLFRKHRFLYTIVLFLLSYTINFINHSLVSSLRNFWLKHCNWNLMLTIFWPVWISRSIEKVLFNRFHVRSTCIFPFYLARHIILLCPHFTPPFLYGYQIWLYELFLSRWIVVMSKCRYLWPLVYLHVVMHAKLILEPMSADGSSHRLMILLIRLLVLIT